MKSKINPNRKTNIFRTSLLISAAFLMAAFILPEDYFTPIKESEISKNLKEKSNLWLSHYGQERVYLQLDKPLYEPGDVIWFSGYVRESSSMQSSKTSDILHVDLIDPKGSVAKSINLIAKNGKAAGDFALEEEAVGGLYKIRAYTNWMKNISEDNYFEKEIQIQDIVLPNLKMKLDFERKAFGAGDEVIAKLVLETNENKPLINESVKYVCNVDGEKILEKSIFTDEEGTAYIRFDLPKKLKSSDGLLNAMISYNGSTESISRSIPIVLNKIKLDFFPEGGDLVDRFENRVAFRAQNEFGKPADIEGNLVTQNGSVLSAISSFHQGMGVFNLAPKTGEKYFVQITKPSGISQQFQLPVSSEKGYILQADNSKKDEITTNINTSEREELTLIGTMRGKVLYSNVINAVPGKNQIRFSTKDFSSGVLQLTLFDSRGVARCERLVFANKSRQLNISIDTEKEKYLPREKVKLNISVKDERGMPANTNLSIAVVNDQFLSFADDKSGNILSELLLQQDIKEKIQEPAFYFNKNEPKSDVALDYLLMTAGWRSFTWEKITKEELPKFIYSPEKTIVSGVVKDAYTGKVIPNVVVTGIKGKSAKTDSVGKFSISKFDLYETVKLKFNAEKYQELNFDLQSYAENLEFYMYNKILYSRKGVKRNRNKDIRLFEGNVPVMDEVAVDMMVAVAEDNLENREEEKVMQVAEKKKEKNQKQEKGNKDLLDKNLEEVRMDTIKDRGPIGRFKKNILIKDQKSGVVYYRARKFPTPVYSTEEKVETRTDFRNTIYWNPNVEVGRNGKTTIEFYASDDITSFRITAEGITADGLIGRGEKNIFTQLPFQMSVKAPVEVVAEDVLSIPLTLSNNTLKPLGGTLTVTSPDGLKQLSAPDVAQTIMPGKSKIIYLDYKVFNKTGTGELKISFKSCGLSDAFIQKIKIVSKGFPMIASFSSQELEKEFSFRISNLVNGSLKATLTAYPNVVSDLLKGIEGILREPYGCFEQTSMSSYPNAMVLDYLRTTDTKDDKLMAQATGLLDKGYKRLITFETKEKGYEWFGSNPGHEALTAYGLMQFVDMKKVGAKVDDDMLKRTVNWLLDRRDGKGGFQRNSLALDNFGRASEEITNAYIVYSLSEAGFTEIKKEYSAAYEDAVKSSDPYRMALLCNASYNLKETTKADQLLDKLIKKQLSEGQFEGTSHSITYSQGQSLKIETTSLAILAILKSNGKNTMEMMNAVKWLIASRGGYGAFGNTQGTVLALKALTEFAKYSKQVKEDGKVVVYVDGKKAGENEYKAGEKNAIVISGLESYISTEGTHDIRVKFEGTKNALPYSVAVSWNTTLPSSQKDCVVDLLTKISAKSAMVGETVRLTATVSNKKNEGIPATMLVIGIPAGFTVQPWQLKELQEKNVFDYYEVSGNSIAIYYRCMAPSLKREINLDLKAEMPGEFEAPASSAYLYYTNELKTWSGPEKVLIKKNG
ncbi:MAG: MG2 domain-containing protein [Bacteroidota bacterium]